MVALTSLQILFQHTLKVIKTDLFTHIIKMTKLKMLSMIETHLLNMNLHMLRLQKMLHIATQQSTIHGMEIHMKESSSSQLKNLHQQQRLTM